MYTHQRYSRLWNYAYSATVTTDLFTQIQEADVLIDTELSRKLLVIPRSSHVQIVST